MKLLSLNLNLHFPDRYFFKKPSLRQRLKILKKEIIRLKPDIIAFQEVTDVLILHQLKFLFKNYQSAAHFHLKVFGGLLTFFDRQKYSLIGKKFTAFSQQGKFFSKQLADRILRKGILTTIFQPETVGAKPLLLINVHLTANYGQKLKDEERQILKIQLKEIAKILAKYQNQQMVKIVAGDFNANFSSKTIQQWLKKINFSPAFLAEACTVCPTTNPLCYRDQHQDYQIDNILYAGAKLSQAQLVFNQKGQFISDHLGLLVEIY